MLEAFIFSGPTLPFSAVEKIFPAYIPEQNVLAVDGHTITFLPPVSEGDVFSVMRRKPRIIGIIDGYFESMPSVWHKEILYAMHQGTHVFGAASMGALRARELHDFGMEGIGAIFQSFADNILEDDDEVTIAHGPAELGYIPLSEAMVNIRSTLAKARRSGMIDMLDQDVIEKAAKSIHYKERSYARLWGIAKDYGLDAVKIERLKHWVAGNRIDQKQEDALALMRKIILCLKENIPPKKTLYHFENTLIWEKSRSNGALPHDAFR